MYQNVFKTIINQQYVYFSSNENQKNKGAWSLTKCKTSILTILAFGCHQENIPHNICSRFVIHYLFDEMNQKPRLYVAVSLNTVVRASSLLGLITEPIDKQSLAQSPLYFCIG